MGERVCEELLMYGVQSAENTVTPFVGSTQDVITTAIEIDDALLDHNNLNTTPSHPPGAHVLSPDRSTTRSQTWDDGVKSCCCLMPTWRHQTIKCFVFFFSTTMLLPNPNKKLIGLHADSSPFQPDTHYCQHDVTRTLRSWLNNVIRQITD